MNKLSLVTIFILALFISTMGPVLAAGVEIKNVNDFTSLNALHNWINNEAVNGSTLLFTDNQNWFNSFSLGITKSLNFIVGNGKSITLKSSGEDYIFKVYATDVNLTGFNLNVTGGYGAPIIVGNNNSKITNNTLNATNTNAISIGSNVNNTNVTANNINVTGDGRSGVYSASNSNNTHITKK